MQVPGTRWMVTAIAIVSIGFGILSLGKPYWTLETTPVWLALVVLLLVVWSSSILHRSVIAIVAISVALTLVVARDAAIELLIYGVLAYTLFSGIHAFTGLTNRDWFRGALGVGLTLLAILGAYWVDVASIAIGLLIGPALIVVSVGILLRTWRGNPATEAHKLEANRHSFGMKVGSVLLATSMLLTTYGTYRAILAEPELDSFTDYALSPESRPGELLRAMPYTHAMPENSSATRILYTTTGMDGSIVLATGIVILPTDVPDEPLPVVLWAHGTTGIDITCAPTMLNDPLGAGAMLFPHLPIEAGWAIVAPDYLGLGASEPHPYIAGIPAAQSSLDAVRAARQLQSVSLSDQTVVWGHSQGGGAALWIGIEQQSYAPDVPLLGIVAMAPASNLPEFIETLMAGPAGPIFGGYILRGYADWYSDVDVRDYVRPGARFSQQMLVRRCLSEPSFLANVASALITEPFTNADLYSGPLYERMVANIPIGEMSAPLFLAQGEADELITRHAQTSYVENLCNSGQIVEYNLYAGHDHMSVVGPDSPMLEDMMHWTVARFAGEPAAQNCTTTSH